MKKHIRILTLLLAVVLLFGFVAIGCKKTDDEVAAPSKSETKQESTSNDSKQEEVSEDPVPLKIFRMAIDTDADTNPIITALEEATNTEIELVTAPWDQWVSKLNLIMTSGEEMDIINLDDSSHPYIQWADEGLVVKLDDYVTSKEDFPYIYSIMNSDTFKAFEIEGEHYYVPGAHDGYDYAIYMRKDWLDNLGLEVPTTPDEFYNVLKAFKEQDPDGNGEDDTTGYIDEVSDGVLEGMMGLFGMFGGSTYSWHNKLDVDENGVVYDPNISEETKNALVYINKLYREGLVNTDLASVVDAGKKYLYTNKGGVGFFTGTGVSLTLEELRKTVPEADFVYVPPMAAPGVEFRPLSGPVYWLLDAVCATSKNPQKAVEFIEYLNSQEGRELFLCGVKDRHYTELDKETGVYDRNVANWQEDFGEDKGLVNALWWGFTSTVHGYIPCADYDTWEEAYDNRVIYVSDVDQQNAFNRSVMIKNGKANMAPKPFTLVKLPEVDDIKVKLNNDVLAVYYLKMVIEADPANLDGLWEQFLEEYDKAGGQEYIQAFQKYYDENLK